MRDHGRRCRRADPDSLVRGFHSPSVAGSITEVDLIAPRSRNLEQPLDGVADNGGSGELLDDLERPRPVDPSRVANANDEQRQAPVVKMAS